MWGKIDISVKETSGLLAYGSRWTERGLFPEMERREEGHRGEMSESLVGTS